MRHAFDIAGSEIELWLAREGAGYRLHRDGGEARVALSAEGGLRQMLTVDGVSEPMLVAIEGELLHVHVGGRSHVIRHLDPARRFADADASGGADMARAPMPGTVVRIDAVLGQAVAVGDPILVIESMKLETTIRAWQDGRIGDIHVSEGQSFDRDAPLVSLTASEA
ncbi:acetyl-CoA carboxylase biotin carboxyl carrier protein subunit [Phreatobacter stygius]|nr:acetyl-CoA carboxylase biotin carboxyl carrier protein subunit [Phreatobacter stygius]